MAVGLLATALLLANNLRDIATDAETGKRTLAVRVGRRDAGWCYVACVGLPFAGVLVWALLGRRPAPSSSRPAAALLPLVALPLVVAPVRLVSDASGRALLPVLAATGRLQLVFGVLLAVALWLVDPRDRGPDSVSPVADASVRQGSRTSVGHVVGPLQVGAWPAPATTTWRAIGPMASASRRPEGGELLVLLAGDHQHRHGPAGPAPPQGLLGPGAGQRRLEASPGRCCAVRSPEPAGLGDDAGEHRAPSTAGRTPPPECDRAAAGDGVEPVGQRLVGRKPAPATLGRRRRCRRSPRSGPGDPTRSGRARARWRQNRAPIEYPR